MSQNGMMGCVRRSLIVLASIVAIALAAPLSSSAHLWAEPAFLAVGSKQRVVLTVHNDRDEVMTGFTLTVPDGFRILGTGGADTWNEIVEGATATWAGGSLAPNTPTTFEVDLEAATVEPGTVELQGDQLYAGDESVRWPVALTVVPPGGSPGDDDAGGGAAIVVLSVLGALVVAMFGLVFWQRRRRPPKLQER
jgi:hypothetical protein